MLEGCTSRGKERTVTWVNYIVSEHLLFKLQKGLQEKLNWFEGTKIIKENCSTLWKIFSLSNLFYFTFPTTFLMSIAWEAFYKGKLHHIKMQGNRAFTFRLLTISRKQKLKRSQIRQTIQAKKHFIVHKNILLNCVFLY